MKTFLLTLFTQLAVLARGEQLAWDYPDGVPVDGFVVYQQEVGTLTGSRQYWVADSRARVSPLLDLIPGSHYQFWVKAYCPDPSNRDKRVYSLPSETLDYIKPLVPYLGSPQVLVPTLFQGGFARITFFGPPGQVNRVWGSTDLSEWALIGTATEMISGQYQCVDGDALPYRFYKIL